MTRLNIRPIEPPELSELPTDVPVQDLRRFQLPSDFRGRPAWFVQLWWAVQTTLFALSPQALYGWRRTLLRLFGARIGRGVIIRSSATITYPWKVTIGDWSWVGDEVVLYSLGSIVLKENVVVSQRSYLCTGSHDYRVPTFDIWSAPIVVEREAWLGTDVYVAPGVSIGRGAVVAARSSVFNDLPPMIVAVGSPARPIKNRC